MNRAESDCHMKIQSPKVLAMYEAVNDLIKAGADINNLKVSDITSRAGIGKGTAYEYFETKEELVSKAIFYQIKKSLEWLIREMQKQEKFKDKIYTLLTHMEDNHTRYRTLTRCLCYYLQGVLEKEHILSNVETYIKNNQDLKAFFEELLVQAQKEGIIQTKIPYFFMANATITQAITYSTYISRSFDSTQINREKMKEIIYNSIVTLLQTASQRLS